MLTIPLTRNKVALVDYEDYFELRKYKWYVVYDGTNWYATNWKLGKMHRFMLNLHDPKVEVDHINGNGLDNRRDNLRTCSHANNTKNKTKHKRQYKGVSIFKCTSNKARNVYIYYRAEFRIGNKRWYGKLRKTELAAAIDYNDIVRKHGNEFNNLNVIA